MFSFKTKAYGIIIFTMGISMFFKAYNQYDLYDVPLLDLFTFIGISLGVEYLPVKLPIIGYVTVNFAIDFAVILIFGPTVAVIVAAVSYLIFCILNPQEEIKVEKIIFNLGQFIITIFAAGLVYIKLGGTVGIFQNHNLIPALVSMLAYFVLNTLLVSIMHSLYRNNLIFRTWIPEMKWAIPNYLALGALGYLVGIVFQEMGSIGLCVLFVPLLLARHSFQLYTDIRDMYLKTIKNLATIIDAKDHYTAGHSERVAQYVARICKEMDLSESYMENLQDIALLHDIGKIGIAEHILNKPGRLNDEEMNRMKSHSIVGYDIIKNITFLKEPEACKYHHERLDGKGYPDGLTAEEIPLGAKIIAVADSYDAMTSDRPYRKGMSQEQAFAELIRCKDFQFDPFIVDNFIRSFSKKTHDQIDEISQVNDKVTEG